MSLDTIYTDFCNHIGIKDTAYEAVFNRFNLIINRMNETKWLYVIYNDKDSDQTVNFDIEHNPTVPLYVLDLIKNCFGNYYTLPNSVIVTIGVSFQNINYEIIYTATETKIPPEISHIMEDDLIKLFTLTSPVRDIFSEFDNLFSFFSKFRVPVKAIFPTLEKKFELKNIKNDVIEGNLSAQEMMQDKNKTEILKIKRQSILKKVDEVRFERDNLISSKENIYNDVNARDNLLTERQKLIDENSAFIGLKEEYEQKLDKFKNILSGIDSELAYKIDNKINDEDTEYLRDKKLVFEREYLSIDKSLSDVLNYLKGASEGLKAIEIEIEKIENYKPVDVTAAERRIKELNLEQDSLYTELLITEQDLKTLNTKNLNESLRIEKAQYTEDETISNIENKALLTHLSSSLQPPSVVTVVNYLRYYFAYQTTLIASVISKENTDGNIYTIQAIAMRIVMAEYFGFKFNNLFSIYDFNHKSINHMNLIVKE